MNYYNEFDPKAVAWLKELIKEKLIPNGIIDQRSITEVKSSELSKFTQCHFFAGIGGWPLALSLAGFPSDRPVWTGSCPCQPFSVAGKGLGKADSRHLWPTWFNIIQESRPPVIFGEQVASKAALPWIDSVFNDLESEDYACGAADLCSASVGSIDIRQRLWWVANSSVDGLQGVQRGAAAQVPQDGTPQALAPWNRSGNPFEDWEEQLAGACVRRMDDGISSELVVRPALRGFGNAINPHVAAEFVKAFLEIK